MRKLIKIFSMILATTILFASTTPFFADKASKIARQTIKVGMPLQSGLAIQDESGELTGYNYDYLQEIAQFTGWEYEFKVVSGSDNKSITDMLQMLKDGEIDMLGGLLFDEELAKEIKYSSYHYATRFDGLYALCDNSEISENNFYSKDPLRVAVLKNAKKANERLDTFAAANNLKLAKVECDVASDKEIALKNGSADVMWETNIASPETTYPVAKYYSQPVYFAFSPQNANLCAEFDSAMLKLSKSSPSISTDLQEKYFSRKQTEFTLNNQEKEYIKNEGVLKVAVAKDHGPAYFFDTTQNVHRGMSLDILNELCDKTGLSYEIIQTETQSEANELIASGQADILARSAHDFEIAKQNNFILSRPYLETQLVMATANVQNAYKSTALPFESAANMHKSTEITYFNTLHECMDAANKGEVGSVFGDSCTIEFEINSRQFQNLVLVPIIGETAAFSFGISKACDVNLLNIINKIIDSFNPQEMQDLIFSNSSLPQDNISLVGFIRAHSVQTVLFVVCLASLLVGFLLFMLYLKSKSANELLLANERYFQLSAISGVHIFDYDFATDTVTLSDSMAKEFECDNVIPNFSKNPENTVIPLSKNMNGLETQSPCEINIRLRNGTTCWYRYTCKTIYDKHGKPARVFGRLANTGAEHKEREMLEKKASEDALTGLLNTSALREKISNLLGNGNTDGSILIVMDIDNFKDINDNFGHYNGDKILNQVASAMRDAFVKCTHIGRFGGDEFMAFLDVENADAFKEIVKELQDRCCLFTIGNNPCCITLSIGAAYYHNGEDFDELFKRADDALYRVKSSGKNNYELV